MTTAVTDVLLLAKEQPMEDREIRVLLIGPTGATWWSKRSYDSRRNAAAAARIFQDATTEWHARVFIVAQYGTRRVVFLDADTQYGEVLA